MKSTLKSFEELKQLLPKETTKSHKQQRKENRSKMKSKTLDEKEAFYTDPRFLHWLPK